MHQRWERKTTSLKLACLIICTMQDSDRANEPHPRSDLCSLRKHGAAYKSYWPGKTKEDRHLSRVAGAVCRRGYNNPQQSATAEDQIKEDLATLTLQTLAPLGLCPCVPRGPDVVHTRVMPSTDCNTDHKLVQTKVRLNIKTAVRKRGAEVKKLHTNKLLAGKIEFEEELWKRRTKGGTAFPQNRSWAPMLTAENHLPGNCWEGRRPLDEEL